MNENKKQRILSVAENGVITARRLTELGISRSVLKELVASGNLIRCSRGIYVLADELEDEFYILQKRYAQGIFSHGTALYLYGYSERVPISMHMTFPTKYNSSSLVEENVIVTRVIPANYQLGVTRVMTPFGNSVNVYNLERSLCDIVRGRGDDIQVINYAMKKYAASRERDINKLIKYAKQLRVEPKIRQYMEVLL